MAEELDKDQIKMLRNAFNAFDKEGKGTIECEMVGTILEMLGQKLDAKELKAVIKQVDADGSGELDFDEFVHLASKFIEPEEDLDAVAKELKEAFRLYDKDGKGYLPVDTLRDILHELDDKLSPEDLDMMIDEIDADGSGTVDFNEFMNVMIG